MLVILISSIVFALDLLSKWFIESHASLYFVKVIPGFFNLRFLTNEGMAWSLLSGQQAFLSMVSAIAIGGMIWYVIAKNPDRLTRVSLALMIGGAAGNLFDRLFLGSVRDFLDFIIFGYDFPVFNLADSALCIGVFLLFIATLKEEKKA